MRSIRKNMRGQAMTEFVIVTMLVLLPLYLLIPLLGKYIDMKAAAIQGARYIAWERTVYFGGSTASVSWPGADKTDAELENEMRRRVMTSGAPFQSTDGSAGTWSTTGFRDSWKNRDSSRMLANYDSIKRASSTQEKSPGIVNIGLNAMVKVVDAIGPFTLELKGLHTAAVSISPSTLPINMSLNGDTAKQFNPGALAFNDHSTVLTNAWSTSGNGHVKKQTQGLTPTSVFENPGVKAAWLAARIVLAPAAPEILMLELGKIEPDVVPPDRLVSEWRFF